MQPTAKKILVIGNAVADVVAQTVDEVPRTGSLHPETVQYFSGGCANNVALVLARLNTPVTLVVCIGDDTFGTVLLNQWQGLGIDTTYVVRHPTEPTGITIVLVDSEGERRFISSPAANRFLTLAHLPPTILDDIFAVQIAGFFTVPALESGAMIPLLTEARQRGILAMLDPVGGSARERRAELLRYLPYLDVVTVNEDEGEKITDEHDPDAIAAVLLAHGATTVIVKVGHKGSRLYTAEGVSVIPPYPATNVDSTGAGDSYSAALLASLARGDTFDKALRWAAAAGAATVEALGATGAWRGWDDLAAKMTTEQGEGTSL
jgi:sugar/nucleoside kinase (ribokinase family)